MDDDKLGRILLKRIAEKLEGLVKSHLGGHDAVMDVDVVLINAGTKVERTNADSPLLADIKVLRAGITIAEQSDETAEAIARCRIVGTRDGECRHVSVIRQPAHPVLGQENAGVPNEEEADKQNLFHCGRRITR